MMNINDFAAMVLDKNNVALTATSQMSPIDGDGAEICPATYADTKNLGAGISITQGVAQRAFNPETGVAEVVVADNGLPVTGASVVVDSIGSQATRAENAIHQLRDVLNLPGIFFNVDSVPAQRLEAIVDKLLESDAKASAPRFSDFTVDDIAKVKTGVVAEIQEDMGRISSWTVAHRHVDGLFRLGEIDGVPAWSAGCHFYDRHSQISDSNLGDLLLLSPNSVLFGFWASMRVSKPYKLGRSFSQNVTGYGATKVSRRSTKVGSLEASSIVYSNDEGDIVIYEDKNGKGLSGYSKPAAIGLGSVPSDRENTAICDSIIGTGTVSLVHLRNVISHDESLSEDDKKAVIVALAAMAVLARALVLDGGDYRSGCILVDTASVWTKFVRGHGADIVPDLSFDVDEAIALAKQAFETAAARGVWGTRDDRIYLDASDRLLDVTVESIMLRMSKSFKGEDVENTSGDA